MKRWIYLLLFAFGLAIPSLVALFQRAPGYMDADYYYAGGLQLAAGQGFREPFLWNYLDDPPSLPHASHAYWMPLASLLAAASMWVSGLQNFTGARFGFLLVAASLPPVTAALTFSLTARRNQALLAGLLAVFPVYYLPVLTTTDNFGLYILLGGVWFLCANPQWLARGRDQAYILPGAGENSIRRYFFERVLSSLCLGQVAGLMHLARADGLIWLGISGLAVLFPGYEYSIGMVSESPKDSGYHPSHKNIRHELRSYSVPLSRLGFLCLGYLIIMGPWMLRNLAEFGTLLAPGGGRALWLIRYDELYAFPASILTPARWWSLGLGPLLQVRVEALWQNLIRAFAVQGSIVLAPLILLGLWHYRRDRRVQWGLLAWVLTLFAMTVIFPHQGWRGGFFHSGAAVQTLLWALAPAGLESFIELGVRRRGWIKRDAMAVFGGGLVALAILLSGSLVYSRVIGPDFSTPAWSGSDAEYRRLESALQNNGAKEEDVVAVNNPAGYYSASGRPAIVIPDGDEETLLAAARRYGARFVLLELNHPGGLNNLYQHPADRPGLDYLESIVGTHIFKVP